MSNNSAIEWCDATWNPLRGCVKVSPGCANCYASTFAERFRGVKGHPYEQGFDLRLVPEKLEEPLRWKKPRRIFVNSMSDLFQDGVSDAYIDRVFAVMALSPQHTFQVLTKRAERMRAYMSRTKGADGVICRVNAAARDIPKGAWWKGAHTTWPWANVWLGVSVENQHFADERIPLLLQTPAAVRFISAEPLLGPINLESLFAAHFEDPTDDSTLDWVIVGGESGHGARPFEVSWARSIVAQCKSAGVPVFVKQFGADPRDAAAQRDDMGARDVWPAGWMPLIDGRCVWRPDLTSRKGNNMTEWPEDLRVREFPT